MLPALRERREDLPALCEALLARIANDSGMPVPTLSAQVLGELEAHPLAGNVRELENLLHRAVALSDGQALQADAIHGAQAQPPAPAAAPATNAVAAAAAVALPAPPAGETAARVPSDLQAYLDQQEREILVRALQETGFNRTAAAQRLGLSLRQIRYRIARLGIPTPGNEDVDEASDA